VGLAVMGENLALNIEEKGFPISVYNRSTDKVDDFIKRHPGKNLLGTKSPAELVASLERPRRIIMMVKAGKPVDDTIAGIRPHLEKDDMLVDGGNEFFENTVRRGKELEAAGLNYVGMGVSGGEEGARHGPSLMPGGQRFAYDALAPILTKIAAQVDDGPCVDYMGPGGAGHYVKMVHNGIEYGDMQLICEAYQLMKDGLGMTPDEMSGVFAEWNKHELDSYLIEITRDILAKKDDDGAPLVDKILDTAGQKGTGKWTVISSADLGIPITLMAEAVYGRCVSAMKDLRVEAAKSFKPGNPKISGDRTAFVKDIMHALYASKIVSYAQGYMLMAAAAEQNKWNLNYGGIALMWRGGCIIRSRFLGKIKEAFVTHPDLSNLLLDSFFSGVLNQYQDAWRKTLQRAVEMGIPTPAFATALAFFDGYRAGRLPANLLQAQRDYFGAHTYERIDKPRGEFFHTNWTGTGGRVSSSTYNV
jgi:6-phosphogluconate dehydrogenase